MWLPLDGSCWLGNVQFLCCDKDVNKTFLSLKTYCSAILLADDRVKLTARDYFSKFRWTPHFRSPRTHITMHIKRSTTETPLLYRPIFTLWKPNSMKEPEWDANKVYWGVHADLWISTCQIQEKTEEVPRPPWFKSEKYLTCSCYPISNVLFD